MKKITPILRDRNIGVGSTINRTEQEDKLKAILKENNIFVTDYIVEDGQVVEGSKTTPLEVTVLDGKYRDGYEKYRVYFGGFSDRKTFVQSDDDGNLDMDKFLKKATEKFEDISDDNKRMIEEELKSMSDQKLADELNEKLEDTGFRVSLKYGRLSIQKDFLKQDEATELVDKLLSL